MFAQLKSIGLVFLLMFHLSAGADEVAKRSLFLAALDMHEGEVLEKTLLGLYVELGDAQSFRTLEFMGMVPLVCEGQYVEDAQKLVLHYRACSHATDRDGSIQADSETTQEVQEGFMSLTVVLNGKNIKELIETESFVKYVHDDFSAAAASDVSLVYGDETQSAQAPAFGFAGDLTQMISLYQQNPENFATELEQVETENPDR